MLVDELPEQRSYQYGVETLGIYTGILRVAYRHHRFCFAVFLSSVVPHFPLITLFQ